MLRPPESPSPDGHHPKKPKPFPSTPDHRPVGKLRLLLLILSLQLLLLFLLSTRSTTTSSLRSCTHGKVYVYDLPPAFNKRLIEDSPSLSNSGLGPPATDLTGTIPSALLPSWHSTDQFAAEPIFHARMLAHRCRTRDPSAAAAFYVPFYAGLAVGRHLWSPKPADRDADCTALLQWIQSKDTWRRSGGRDHFIALGRITWDFRRSRDGDWGGSLLKMKGMENVTRLVIERNPWDGRDVGVPYPAGFHPRTSRDLQGWRDFVLSRNRSTLFGFAGAVRAGMRDDFRGVLVEECRRAEGRCREVDCGEGRCGNRSREVVSLFLGSEFCLQPRGDSFTRRSLFDCMVAGAVPVVFWRRSLEGQYGWYLPEGGEGEWWVFVDGRRVRRGAVSVREALEGIGAERARRMRERVVEMIPRIVYAGAAEGVGDGVGDAVDVAVDGVLRRFSDRRRGERRSFYR